MEEVPSFFFLTNENGGVLNVWFVAKAARKFRMVGSLQIPSPSWPKLAIASICRTIVHLSKNKRVPCEPTHQE